jgi:hypothetical protein
MSNSSSVLSSTYRAAVSLNNLAVTLLERQCYHQAMETFKDAVSALKASTMPSTTSASAVTKGFRRIYSPKPQRLISMHLEVLSSENMSSAAALSLNEGPSSSRAYLVRLDQVDIDDMMERGPDIESACILHNFAVAYLCMSQVTANDCRGLKFRNAALKLFSASQSLLESRCHSSIDDEDLFDLVICLQAIVLGNLVQILCEIHGVAAAKQMYNKMVNLRTHVHEISATIELCELQHQNAAAAA